MMAFLQEKALLTADNPQTLQSALRAAPARIGVDADKLIETATSKKLTSLDETVRETFVQPHR
jgi:hypothetical protein